MFNLVGMEELKVYINRISELNAVSANFNSIDKTVSYLVGGGKVIKKESLSGSDEDIHEVFSFLKDFKHSIDIPLVVSKFDYIYIVRPLFNLELVDAGYDEVHVKLIDTGVARTTGLSIISSNKYDNIPLALRSIYFRLKESKPDLNIQYVTCEEKHIDHNVDILFIEETDVHKRFGDKIKDIVLSGIPVITGIVAGNSMFAIEKVSEFIPYNILGSFSFLNTLVHQRSVPKVCSHCALDFAIFSDQKGEYAHELLYRLTRTDVEDVADLAFNGDGCGECYDGYEGETLCVDVIVPDYEMLDLIKIGEVFKAWRNWRKYHADESYVGKRFEDHAFVKMKEGIISPVVVEQYFENLNIQVLLEDGMLTSEEVNTLSIPT